MKPSCAKWMAAQLLAASLALSSSTWAGSGDGQLVRGEPAGDELAAAVERSATEQLARANAAYARADYAEAFRLYRNIAVLGIPEAHYRLGLMYIDGLGTRKSMRQAEYWLKLAAAEHHPGAAEALASIGTGAHG